jgi:hypothetical protein
LAEQIREAVLSSAKQKVPYDPEQDAWHGPTQCVWDVAWWAALVAVHVLVLRRSLPEKVRQVWQWVAAGHWPCGQPERCPAAAGQRLMVY